MVSSAAFAERAKLVMNSIRLRPICQAVFGGGRRPDACPGRRAATRRVEVARSVLGIGA
jgi:hypothetical protein